MLITRSGTPDAMDLDFQCVQAPSTPGFMAFRPSRDLRIPVLMVTA
jgi:hypothetical protein